MHAALHWIREKTQSRLLHVIASLAVVACLVVFFRRPVSDPVLRIGIQQSPPYQIVQPGGAPDGAAVAILREAANRAHVRLVWSVELEGPDAAFEQGKVDLWPLLESTADRSPNIHVSLPWMISEFALVTRKDAGLKKVEQVAGKRVAFMSTPASRALVETYLPRVITVERTSRLAVLQAVCAGDADAAFLNSRFAQSMLMDHPAQCENVALRYTLVNRATIPFGVASTKSHSGLADRLADEIRKMGTDGTLASILSDWSVICTNDTETLRTAFENLQRQRAYLVCVVLVMAVLLTVLTMLARKLNAARDLAKNAMKAKASFLTNMSHEIRTPMNGVVGMTNLLFTTDLTDEQRGYAEEAQHSADSLLEMLNNILDYSRMDQGTLQFANVDFDVRGLLEDVAEHYAPNAARKRLEIACVMDHDVPGIVNGDPVKLRQVLSNLMSNAVKFTARGEVVLSAKVISEEVAGVVLQIEVTDTGIGIDEKEHPKLFRSFAQLENPECRAQAGAGLGLAICKQIVAGGGGYIDYHSTPGLGSSFWIVMRFGKAEYELPLLPADPVVAGRKVLVIARSRAVRRMVRDHCRSLAMRTWEAEDEVRAIQLVREAAKTGAPFDLVVGDAQTTSLAFIALPGPSGEALILLTAPPRHGKEEIWPDGVDAILTKPVREAQFVRTAQALLTNSRTEACALQGTDGLPTR